VSVPPSTVIAGLIPARLTPASRVVTGPRLRGTAPRARSPRAARARRRVIEVCVPHSSTNTPRAGSTPPICARHSARAVSSRSVAVRLFASAAAALPELADVLVTADALHCQRGHADFLATRGGHYLFTVKGNQPMLRQELMRLPWAQAPGTRRRGSGHGRIESRSIKVIDLDGTDAQALFPGARRAIKVVRRRRIGAGKPSVEIVYAVTSLDHRGADCRLLADWLQGHWAIENSVHHVRDVTQREDASRIRLGAGPQLMAALRNTATNIARLTGHANIAAAQRTAAWSPTAITEALHAA
jgi:predicted transposase YbfD/YdcC